MISRSFCFVAVALLGYCVSVPAAEWFVVAVDEPNDSIIFINKGSAQGTGNEIVPVRVAEVNGDPERSYDTEVFRYEFNCRTMRMRMLGSAVYRKGRMTKTSSSVMEWSGVFPHTHTDSMRLAACGKVEMFFGVKREFKRVFDMTREGQAMLRNYNAQNPSKTWDNSTAAAGH